MRNQYDLVFQLTAQDEFDRSRWLNDFAFELGWHPSDRLDTALLNDITTSHLLVEHGLENTAVISFLRHPHEFSNLTFQEKNRLLSVSYNNLVDWHIQVELNYITFVYNRVDPIRIVDRQRISRDNFDSLYSDAFEQIIGRRPNPNLPALDDALIDTISHWKRNLSAELGYAVSNEALSELFNAIIFIRAAEDHQKRIYGEGHQSLSPSLVEIWRKSPTSVRNILFSVLNALTNENVPGFLGDGSRLDVFDDLDYRTAASLFVDFYRNKYAPYPYDFSLMSKHALSRIYEHYVSILRVEDSLQASFPFFSPLPKEEQSKVYGSYYTPQFIARFFARYLREQMPPRQFRSLKIADPACGSGMFLRTILELQCDPTYSEVTTSVISQAFENVLGIDVDENAARATQLSLSLLYLVLTDKLPEQLNIISVETIDYFLKYPELKNSFDAVMANPPFVSWDNLASQMRDRITEFMSDIAEGRVDLNLAFLKIGLEMLKPGGFGFFILPHSFLLKKSSQGMRQFIAEASWIRCLVDLSAIPVFEEVGAYVILLIFQKKPDYADNVPSPSATVVRCQDFVGRALQETVEGKQTQNSFYSIHTVSQTTFNEQQWLIVPPTEAAIKKKFAHLAKLEDFLKVRQGFISGADSIFIIKPHQLPSGEMAIYAPFLPDRKMQAYTTPQSPSRYVFYPYVDGKKIDGQRLQNEFPQTWEYLVSHRKKLEGRKSLRNSNKEWWEPIRPRLPENMLRPKIISPHLVLVPRFSYDAEGVYAISHSPLMYVENSDENGVSSGLEPDLLRYFLAILNSSPCYWYIANHSHIYSKGYVMLEPRTLAQTPVPAPANVSPSLMSRLLSLVDLRLQVGGVEARKVEQEIDEIAAELYQLTGAERQAVGME